MLPAKLSVNRKAFESALYRFAKLCEPKRHEEALISFDGAFLHVECQGTVATAPAQGHWPGKVRIPAKFVFMLAELPPPGDPIEIYASSERFHVGSCSINTISSFSAESPVHLAVDKSSFIEVGCVFKKNYRHLAANVLFTLGNNMLKIEFYGGGCDLKCESSRTMRAETTAKAFSKIISAHRHEKDSAGTIILTFNSRLREFSTPLEAVPAKFHYLT
jgi:hypothetical protein